MYGQQPPTNAYDEIMNRLGQAKEVNHRDPFITVGAHDLIVCSVETFKDQKWGDSVRATFEYEQSSSPSAPARTCCVKIWNLFKPSKFPTQATDADDFVDFVCKLQGIPLGQHHNACRALVKSEREGGQLERQPARGARIKAFGQEVGKPNERGQRYVKVTWQNAPQDMARIAAARAELDQRHPLGVTSAQAVQPAPQMQQGYPVAPQMQQAPQPNPYAAQAAQLPQHPAQHMMGQGYPPAAPQMQYPQQTPQPAPAAPAAWGSTTGWGPPR